MKPHFLHATAAAALFALAALGGCAGTTTQTGMSGEPEDVAAAYRYAEFTRGSAYADCVAAGGMTEEGMPASPHQMMVLDDEATEADAAEAAAIEPAAGCTDMGGMPATPHQQELLDEDTTEGGSY